MEKIINQVEYFIILHFYFHINNLWQANKLFYLPIQQKYSNFAPLN